MQTNHKRYLSNVLDVIIGNNDVIKATKFISPTEIIRAVRRTYGGKIDKKGRIEISLTIGKPNYVEREFISLCTKAKEPFPIKKVLLKMYAPKKKK